MAYYRAGWAGQTPRFSGNFWTAANNNFLDMCVLDYCKLFAEQNGLHCWKRVVKDPARFKADLLAHLGLGEGDFEADVLIFREYRDKWVAHLDAERKGLYPRLEFAKKAVWFYYDHVGKEQVDEQMNGKPLDTGYRECEEEARQIYRQAAPGQGSCSEHSL